ncbi:MAG: hypothetical protein HW380_473 [Magnetococcales bacterium]|nr:hypothetical protein [Magnetococcales bacterium]HIJ85529.1 hypothetical protein [Magnetococcales bacterium]
MMFLRRLQSVCADKNGSRGRVMDLHGRIVDAVLSWTAEDRLGLKDDFPLRFEVMLLAVATVITEMQQDKTLAQSLWDMTFEGFEESLRQRGVNDIRMGARMRVLLQNGMGRCRAYMDAMKNKDDAALRQAVVRNVFNGTVGQQETVEILLSSVLKLPRRVLDGQNS